MNNKNLEAQLKAIQNFFILLTLLTSLICLLTGYLIGTNLMSLKCFDELRYSQFIRWSYNLSDIKIPEGVDRELFYNQSVKDIINIDDNGSMFKILMNYDKLEG